jgi:predicted CXXCH cytochrome family protein
LTRKKILLMLSWAGFLVFVFVILGLAAAEEGTRAQDDYQGVTTCAGASCHDDIITAWNVTPHSDAWNTLVGSGQKEDWCEDCHTTGANDSAHNGFDPITDLPDFLKNVQCESCHGPDPMNASGGASTRIDHSAEVCSRCHQTIATSGTSVKKYHPYYNEWINSSHSRSLDVAGGQVATDPNCQKCHVSQVAIVETFEGGTFTGPVVDPQPITCPTCHDPHGSANPYQLRKPVAELCGSCHHPTDPPPGEVLEHPQSAMREGESEIPPSEVPVSSHMPATLCMDCHMYSTTGPPPVTGHEFKPKPEACAVCHDGGATTPQMDVAQSAALIEYWQGNTDDYIFATTNNATEASLLHAQAEKLGFSQTVRDQAQALCDNASYSLTYVEADGSQGVHNPTYAWNLLNYSNGKANEAIALLQTGTVLGKLEDDNGNPIHEAQIVRNGFALQDGTLPNGTFMFDYAPGQFTFEAVMDGQTIGSISDVEVTAGELVDVGTYNFPPLVYDYTGYIILGFIIIVVIILIAGFYWFRLRERDDET